MLGDQGSSLQPLQVSAKLQWLRLLLEAVYLEGLPEAAVRQRLALHRAVTSKEVAAQSGAGGAAPLPGQGLRSRDDLEALLTAMRAGTSTRLVTDDGHAYLDVRKLGGGAYSVNVGLTVAPSSSTP